MKPRQPKILFALGPILTDTRDPASAVENLGYAAALDPANADYFYSLGLALRVTGDIEGAGGRFRDALKLNPKTRPGASFARYHSARKRGRAVPPKNFALRSLSCPAMRRLIICWALGC